MEVHYITVIPHVSTVFGRLRTLRPRAPQTPPDRRSARLRLGGLLELSDLTLEVGKVLEALVNRRESQIGHVVERPPPLDHRHPDPVARDLAAHRPQLLFDGRDELVDGRVLEAPRCPALAP